MDDDDDGVGNDGDGTVSQQSQETKRKASDNSFPQTWQFCQKPHLLGLISSVNQIFISMLQQDKKN